MVAANKCLKLEVKPTSFQCGNYLQNLQGIFGDVASVHSSLEREYVLFLGRDEAGFGLLPGASSPFQIYSIRQTEPHLACFMGHTRKSAVVNDLDFGLSFLLAQTGSSLVTVFWYTLIFDVPRYLVPFVIAAMSLRHMEKDNGTRCNSQSPSVSIVLIGHNEADSIGACVISLMEQSFGFRDRYSQRRLNGRNEQSCPRNGPKRAGILYPFYRSSGWQGERD